MNRTTTTLFLLAGIALAVHRASCPGPEIVDGFLTPDECRRVIARATALGVQRSTVANATDTRRVDSARTSSHVFLPAGDPVGDAIKTKVSRLTGVPTTRMEDVQVVHYAVGELYKPHFDACNDGCDGGHDMPRTMTVYMYLNDVTEGGSTSFPAAGVRVQPARGRAVVWTNTDASGENLPCALHGADPVLRGEKWGCNVWIR